MSVSSTSIPENKPRVLYLLPGPLFDVGEALRARLERVSDAFEGGVVTFAEKSSRSVMGRFDVHALQFRPRQRVSSMREMFRAAMAMAATAAAEGRPFAVVSTYDTTKTGLVGWRVSRAIGAKLIVEVNGDCFAWANYADIANPARRYLERALFIAITGFVLRQSDGTKILFANQIDRFDWLLRRPVIRRFPNFVDLDRFSDRGEQKIVLLVGFPFKVKGVDILIEAFKKISQQFPDWQLHIVGFYPDPSEVMRAINGHERISLLPPVPRDELAQQMGRCAIVALPSRTEGVARVLMEAAACGKTRVATTVGGLPDVIAHDIDGLLCPPEDDEALAALLARAMGDPELRCTLGRNARARAAADFSGSAYVRKLREFYGAVLEDRGVESANGRRLAVRSPF